MYNYSFLKLQITRSDISPHIKCVGSLVIAYGHFNLPKLFVWVCMVNMLTISISPLRVANWCLLLCDWLKVFSLNITAKCQEICEHKPLSVQKKVKLLKVLTVVYLVETNHYTKQFYLDIYLE